MTANAEPKFVVKESAKGEAWIAIEYLKAEPGFPTRLFGFALSKRVSLVDAQVVAPFLNKNVRGISHTP